MCSRCSFQDDCLQPSAWISISEDSQQQDMVSYQVEKSSSGEKITLTVKVHLNVHGTGSLTSACIFLTRNDHLCDRTNPAPALPQCSCLFSSDQLPAEGDLSPSNSPVDFSMTKWSILLRDCFPVFFHIGLNVTVKIRVGKQNLTENLMLTNCSDITGPPTSALSVRNPRSVMLRLSTLIWLCFDLLV